LEEGGVMSDNNRPHAHNATTTSEVPLHQFGHADGRGRIWVYDKTTDSISRRSVEAVATHY